MRTADWAIDLWPIAMISYKCTTIILWNHTASYFQKCFSAYDYTLAMHMACCDVMCTALTPIATLSVTTR